MDNDKLIKILENQQEMIDHIHNSESTTQIFLLLVVAFVVWGYFKKKRGN